MLVALLAAQVTSWAQVPDPCSQPWTNQIPIRTAWNYVTNGLDPTGGYTYQWQVIGDPDPLTAEPRPANVIVKHPAWSNPLPNSEWIASTPTYSNWVNGRYTFQFCFCLADVVNNPSLVLRVMADDSATVRLNGTVIGNTGAGAFTTPTTIGTSNAALFRPGVNCITVEVDNIGSVAAGLNIAGTMTTGGAQIIRPECCDRNNVITGTKWQDLNCNGVRDPGEAGLAGWVINLSNGQSAITDGNGNYYIMNVPPGTYTVSETPQIGWTQTFPASVTYSVTVFRNDIRTGRDFGNCPIQKCFEILNPTITCSTLPGTTTPAYSYNFTIKNTTPFTARYLNFIPLLPATGITVTPNPLDMGVGGVPPGGTAGPFSVYITGPNAIPGTTIKIRVRMCNVANPSICCEEIVELKLPICDCLRMNTIRLDCKVVNGQQQYNWCFSVTNMSTVPMTYFTVIPPAGVIMSPPPVTYIVSLAPGATSATYCVTLTGPSVFPGASLTFTAELCNKQRTYCCHEQFTIVLPPCPPDCCANFTKLLHHLTNGASWTGAASLNGFINAWNGPANIIGASFTIVSSTIDGQPAYGYFTSGNIGGAPPLGPGITPPPPGYPYPHDIAWGPNSTPSVLLNAPFNVQMQFPAMAPWKMFDVLRYAIRVRFTDQNCVTCETVVYITRVRYRFIIFPGPVVIGPVVTSPVVGTLLPPGGGRLNITFPPLPDGSGITYVGMSLRPVEEGIGIVDAGAEGYDVYVADGAASSSFVADPGTTMNLDFVLSDIEERQSVATRLTLRYVLDHDRDTTEGDSVGGDTVTAEFGYVFRMPDAVGGDQLSEMPSPESNVRTYALDLTNANLTGEAISQLVLKTPTGVKVLAVGPTGSPSRATLNIGSSASGTFVSEDIDGARIVLGPGESVRPLWVTLSGIDASKNIGFTTLNVYGQPITEGTITLGPGSPGGEQVSGTGSEAPMQATTGNVLMQSVPNPTATSATIELALPRSLENAVLIVTDATGNEVARLLDGRSLGAGEHAIYFDTAKLPTGTYYYTLRANGVAETRTMQIVR